MGVSCHEQTHVPITFFLELIFISRFFRSIDEFLRDTFRRTFLLCLGGGITPVFDTYVVVVGFDTVPLPLTTEEAPTVDRVLREPPGPLAVVAEDKVELRDP